MLVVCQFWLFQTTDKSTPPSMKSSVPEFEALDDEMADVLRQKSAAERLRIAGRMWRSARAILRGAIKTEHPDWDLVQVDREIARRISHGVVDHELG